MVGVHDDPADLHLGSGVSLRWLSRAGTPTHIGAFITFGDGCDGVLYFDVPEAPADRPRWQVQSWEPLTITPSVRLTAATRGEGLTADPHEHHGYITSGQWQEC